MDSASDWDVPQNLSGDADGRRMRTRRKGRVVVIEVKVVIVCLDFIVISFVMMSFMLC